MIPLQSTFIPPTLISYLIALPTSLVVQMVKHLSTMRETWVRALGWEDPLEEEMATHSSTIAWKISWTEEPGRLQSMASQRVGHDWVTSLSPFTTPIIMLNNKDDTWCLYLVSAFNVKAWCWLWVNQLCHDNESLIYLNFILLNYPLLFYHNVMFIHTSSYCRSMHWFLL